jgi:ubiquinone/menaquinone biosynthesis C-methylase UbiE
VTFERDLYDPAYFTGLHPQHWFKNPPRKYEERNRDLLRVIEPEPEDRIVELGSARGDVSFLLSGRCREVIGVDAAPEALVLAEEERIRRGISNVHWLLSDVADLSPIGSGSVDAVAAIDLVEHIDDRTLRQMLTECRRILKPGGRLGIYTPDRLHYVERMKAHNLLLRQFPQHIAVRTAEAYRDLMRGAGLRLSLDTWSVSPFPGVRHLERSLSLLPFLGRSFRYRILLQARTVAP